MYMADEQEKPVEAAEPAPRPGKTYLRLLSFLEGDVKLTENQVQHAFFLVVEDVYGNQGVCPMICLPNYEESIRHAFKRLKPLAMVAINQEPEKVDGERVTMDNLTEVSAAGKSIKTMS
jgi:hypothetical protein